ncbi:hypothetical protein STHAL_23370 [Streptomyces halstedii]|uniref:Uncharacterized protein n=1 Tax=Streptomyces halstedii TaxID=1944 RepID=A0ABS6TVW5_STRHA|nr:hypothetical protein [Streptomyces halstedii]MBV7672394.1 hypothetical protein [Streptomyces halstedii]
MAARYRLVGTLRNPGAGTTCPRRTAPTAGGPAALVEEARSRSRFILT